MKIHVGSFVRSGTVAAVVAGFVYLLALTPFFDTLVLGLLIAGIVLIPMGAGLYYGYLAPGEETMGQSVVGGALSGLISGVILGIAFGINAFTVTAISTGLPGYAALGSVTVTILFVIVAGIFAAIMGAIGGALWQLVQR